MSTTPVWDDPLSVALVAAQLLGKTAKDYRTALQEARGLLKQASHVIREENEESAFEAAMDAEPMPERQFIDSIVAGHCKDQRFDRRKAFFKRVWCAMREKYPVGGRIKTSQ